jgi:LCP family protein required for cell wall assembly
MKLHSVVKGGFMKKSSKIVLATITVLVVVVGIVSSYFYGQLNKVKKVEIPTSNSELKISDNAAKQDDEIINIAFFGVDRRHKDEASRSDALMILTLDKKHKKVKISSVMRDSYVNVDGYGMTKVNHAYAYDGATLAIKTLNKNFDLNIKDYVTVDFFGFEKIIDSVGGVDININPEELKYINENVKGTSKLQNAAIPTVTKVGLQKLNGRQAVAYTRIRYTAGGDFERTQRQRTVLVAVLNKIKETNPTNIANVVSQLLPYTETSMSNTEILKSIASISTLGIKDIEQQRFPLDEYCDGKMINGVWYLMFDLDATKNQMHKYIFEDIKPNATK